MPGFRRLGAPASANRLSRVRVAFYTESVLLGGAERALGNLASALDGRIGAAFIGTDPGVVRYLASRRPGSDAVVVPRVRGKHDIRGVYVLARAFRRVRADVVHANLTFITSEKYALPAAMLARTPLVAVEHLPATIENAWQRFIKQCAARLYAAHVTVGEASAHEIEQALGLSDGSVEVIYNGVEDFRVEQQPGRSGPRVGTVARLVAQKGLDVLIRAAVDVPEARFVLIGDGPDRRALEEMAMELGVRDRVEFAGWIDDPRTALGSFDVFVLSSRYEALPMALVDAMLAERAIVATRVGSIPEVLVDGEHGLLVPAEDPSGARRGAAADARGSGSAQTARSRSARPGGGALHVGSHGAQI
jgi:glycosyltransferase involved in cell wall biosynthesis